MKKPTGKCFAANCEKCNWYKEMYMEKWENGKPTGIKEMRTVCKFEELFDFLHRLAGDFDGFQEAANQARNRSMETRARVEEFGQAMGHIVTELERKRLG